MLQTGRSWIRFPMRLLNLFSLLSFSAALYLELTQPLTEISTSNLPEGLKRNRRVRLVTSPLSVPIVQEVWHRFLTTLWALSEEKSGLYVVFSFCWASPAQPFSDLSPTGLMNVLYCLYFWDSPNQEGQVPVFISPRNRAAQLYPPALGLSN
jgi:hypothetical protein